MCCKHHKYFCEHHNSTQIHLANTQIQYCCKLRMSATLWNEYGMVIEFVGCFVEVLTLISTMYCIVVQYAFAVLVSSCMPCYSSSTTNKGDVCTLFTSWWAACGRQLCDIILCLCVQSVCTVCNDALAYEALLGKSDHWSSFAEWNSACCANVFLPQCAYIL